MKAKILGLNPPSPDCRQRRQHTPPPNLPNDPAANAAPAKEIADLHQCTKNDDAVAALLLLRLWQQRRQAMAAHDNQNIRRGSMSLGQLTNRDNIEQWEKVVVGQYGCWQQDGKRVMK